MANDEHTSPWAQGAEPRPDDIGTLVSEIKFLAAARRRDARNHPTGHQCDGCKIRRIDQARQALQQKRAS